MKNNYIFNKGYYIKEDLESISLYFDYFSLGLQLPKYVNYAFFKKFFHLSLRILVIIIYFSKMYKYKYKILSLSDEAHIIIKGRGKYRSTIKLIKENGKLKIVKKLYNKHIFLKKKRFYDTYKNNPSKIKISNFSFLKNNTIVTELLQYKTFQRLIMDGSLNLNQSLLHYRKIKKELKIFYGNKTLIHGDLWPTNILIGKNFYYLIDFSESNTINRKYDLYVLFYSILSSFHFIKINDKTITNNSFNLTKIIKLLGTNIENLLKIEQQFINYRKKRFPNVYYRS